MVATTATAAQITQFGLIHAARESVVRCIEGRLTYFGSKSERCIESYVIKVYVVNDIA